MSGLGVTLSQADCLIAAGAVGVGARLATGKPKDFPMREFGVEVCPVGKWRAREGRSPLSPHIPYERPITSSMISSLPAPIRLSLRSRHARSIPYSFMYPAPP